MPEMKQLVRTTLDLEQFECEKCGRMVYISKIDLEALTQKDKDNVIINIIIPDCPFECWSETEHRRTLRVEVKEVKSWN